MRISGRAGSEPIEQVPEDRGQRTEVRSQSRTFLLCPLSSVLCPLSMEKSMSPSVLTQRSLAERFAAEFPTSKQLHDQAREVFPDGVTHDLRHLEPFPVYVD